MRTLVGRLQDASTGPAPKIECYPAGKTARPSTAILIFPGGGYAGLADYEGEGYARFLAGHGFSCFVVSYRLGSEGFRHPAMLEDALAAIAVVRASAAEIGVDPGRIGVMGSSAGGHLAALAMVAWGRYRSDIPLRPDFGVLCYPVVTMRGAYAHEGSRANLIGESPDTRTAEEVSCELHVTPGTPRCFLWHTREDSTVPFQNSMLFAAALQECGVPFELHIFDRGPHGLGQELTHPWTQACLHWLRSLG